MNEDEIKKFIKSKKWVNSMGEKEEWYNQYDALWSKKLLEQQELQRQEDVKKRQEYEKVKMEEELKKINNQKFVRFCKENFPNAIFAFIMESGIEL